ncbi:MAG TPA: acyl-CoA dehydrogenase family protein, partial [Solirubrobacterales bacterium]|nr:acyl-CoA dehydrogenase family protein [Solirubrobacterales bacterium]
MSAAAVSAGLDADAIDYLKVVEDFCRDRIAPVATQIDRSDEWFPDVLKECADLGLQGIMVGEDRAIDASRIFV